MDVDNIRLPWDDILESYIKHHEQVRPDLNVRAQMAPIIESLKKNSIKSRVIMSSGSTVCYAFYLSPESLTDRYYGLVGFVSPDDFNPDRLKNILNWLISEAERDHKILMFNEVFNAENYGEYLAEMGFSRIDRIMMRLNIADAPSISEDESNRAVSILPIVISEVPELVRMHEEAFRDSQDIILESSNAAERNRFWVNLFEGKVFGRFIPESSLWLVEGGEKSGAIIVTIPEGEPVIVDIFIIPEKRGRGSAALLLRRASRILSGLGYLSVALWVTKGNPAIKLYREVGFEELESKSETIFFKKC